MPQGYMAYLRVEPLANIKSAFSWESLSCVGNLSSIGLACRLYANGHNDKFPTNFSSIQVYGGWPLILFCPRDASRSPTDSWSLVNFTNTSYVLKTNVQPDDTTNVLAVCKVHGFHVLADGSVFPYPFAPPQITSQPASATVAAGSTAVLSVSATGTSLVFQWRKNGTNVNGATSATLALSNVTTSQEGQYSVWVSNTFGLVTSAAAMLTIAVLPTIAMQPQSQTTNAGSNVTFAMAANGTAPLSYQWRFNGTNKPGATNSALTLTNAQSAQAGNYVVVVTNLAGATTSQVATLTIRIPPSIASEPQNQTVNEGKPATLSALVNGTAPLSYQWRFGSTNISGATNTTLALTNVQAAQAGNYSLVASNAAGTATSQVAALTVRLRPALVTQPASKVVGAGANVSFGVAASGTGPLTYQWQFNGANQPAATNTTLTLSNVQPAQAGNYSVIVSNTAGVTNSGLTALSLFGARKAGSNAELTIWGPTGRTYRVDYVNVLSNAQTWAVLTNISLATNFGVVTDPTPRTQ